MGSLAGSLLFPTQLPPGPKISDNRTTTSIVGNPVSILLGTANLSGTVMWLAPYVEIPTESGGKGGPEQRTYNYTQSIAIGLCERIDDDAPDEVTAIAGISRIWENGAIVYDIRPQQAANSDLNSLAETDEAYASRLAASAAYATTFVLYLGDELQEADPTIQAIQGVQNTPAFRGLAYIVYPNRNLTIAQGLRHPNFQFECFQNGIGDCDSNIVTSTNQLFPWISGGANPENSRNINQWTINFFDVRLLDPTGHSMYVDNYLGWNGKIFSSGADCESFMAQLYGAPMHIIGYRAGTIGETSVAQTGAPQVSGAAGVAQDPNIIEAQVWFDLPSAPNFFLANTFPGPYVIGEVYFQDQSSQAQVHYTSGPYQVEGGGPPPAATLPYTHSSQLAAIIPWDGIHLVASQDSDCAMVTCQRFPNAPPDPCLGLPASTIPGFGVQSDGTLVKCGPWTKLVSPLGQTTFKALQKYVASGGFSTTTHYPLNPCMAAGDPNDTMATWTAAYAAAVAAGQMAAGLTYKATQFASGDYPVWQNFMYTNDLMVCQASGNEVSVAAVITAICKRAGLTAIDVSDLEDVFIDGYAISSVCTGSSIITPLRSIAFFDAVETGGLIKFAARGKPSVATLTPDDFGCYDQSQGIDGQDNVDSTGASNCPPSITTTRSQDEDLPRSIRFHYIATMRDYEDGEQDSPFRLATAATNDVDVTVPVCLDDTLAAKCASVLWADAWAGRSAYEISVDQSWLELDVGDCINVPVDGLVQRMRIVSDTNSSAVLRKLSLVGDDEGSFISFAVASAPQRVPQQLKFLLPTSFELLDLPCLQDADSDPGFYVAAQRSADVAGTWSGCVIYKSNDGGSTFTSQFSLTTEATIGNIGLAIPESQAFTWDDETQIIVNVLPEFSFESQSDDAVLAGANAAAMGADGRWEIVQFGIATQLSTTQWQLSHLLRGRRGTEYVMGSSKSNDQFIMVSTGDLGRVVLETTEIGASRMYKGVTIGADYTTGVDETFTGHGQALVCFSPVNGAAQRDTAGDVVISWVRRSRLGRTLMSGVDIPLGETTEAFSIDILTDSPEVVLRTLTSSTTSVVYSHADQVADFGSPVPSHVNVAIYQLSSIVGRGTPFKGTLEIAGV